MIIGEKYLNKLAHTYASGKRVAFYEHVKLIPSEYEGVKDTVFKCREDHTDPFGIVSKKGEPLVELYIYISNPSDKFAIRKSKVKEKVVDGHGPRWETEIYPDAYKKYLKFKEDNSMLEDEITLRAKNEELTRKLFELQEKEKRAKEKEQKKVKKDIVNSAKSSKKEKKVENDTPDNSTEHSK